MEIIYAAGASTSPFPPSFCVSLPSFSSSSPFFLLFTLYSPQVTQSIFGRRERTLCPGRREPFLSSRRRERESERSSLYPLACRSLRLMDVDTPIISRSAGNITNILLDDDIYIYTYTGSLFEHNERNVYRHLGHNYRVGKG